MTLVGELRQFAPANAFLSLMVSSSDVGQATFTTTNGSANPTHSAANLTMTTESNGHRMTQTTSSTGTGHKTIVSVTKDARGQWVGTREAEGAGSRTARSGRRALRRRGRGRNVQIWTLGKLTGSQEFVNFRSSNFQGIVYGSIRGGR